MAAGGLPVRRIDQRLAATSHAGVGPAPSNVFVGTRVIVFGTGPGRGIFVYSPTPGAGNLVASIAAAAGTDPFGNAYPAGIMDQSGTGPGSLRAVLAGGILQLTALGSWTGQIQVSSANPFMQLLSPTSGPGRSMIQLKGGTVAAEQILLGDSAASAVTSTFFEVQGSSALGNIGAAPLPSGFAAESYALAGVEHGLTGAGFDGGKSLAPPADITSRTVIAAAAAQLTGSLSLPANDVSVGTTYRLRASGNGTQGSTVQALTFNLNAIGNTALEQIPVASGFAGISVAFRWTLEAEITCVTTGAGGTAAAVIKVDIDPGANPSVGTSTVGIRQGTALAWNTTAAQTMRVDALWASATGAPTITCNRTTFERIGP